LPQENKLINVQSKLTLSVDKPNSTILAGIKFLNCNSNICCSRRET